MYILVNVCNGHEDCPDHSDEFVCNHIVLTEPTYDKTLIHKDEDHDDDEEEHGDNEDEEEEEEDGEHDCEEDEHDEKGREGLVECAVRLDIKDILSIDDDNNLFKGGFCSI